MEYSRFVDAMNKARELINRKRVSCMLDGDDGQPKDENVDEFCAGLVDNMTDDDENCKFIVY
jgi:hypothetical protein